jgi:hypothetical protein
VEALARSASPPAFVSLTLWRNWSEEFQELIETSANLAWRREQRATAMCTLIADFTAFAERTSRVLVAELGLPDERKSIRPAKLAGVAGGVKYKHGNALFKFARCQHGLFGGDDALAAKAACNELRHLNAVAAARAKLPGLRHLHTPLCAVLLIGGHCVVAAAWTPLSGRQSLVAGSDDAGDTLQDPPPRMKALMETLGRHLSLAPHVVKDNKGVEHSVLIAGDVEGHVSRTDGRLYLCDLARLLPPLPPRKGRAGDHLYRVFRPEFMVNSCKTPVSADAFSSTPF